LNFKTKQYIPKPTSKCNRFGHVVSRC